MPVNRRYPLAELMAATNEYIARTNRRVSFEYVLLQGRNDTPELAEELAGLVKGMLCHVNLIPWNPVPGTPLERSHRRRVRRFRVCCSNTASPARCVSSAASRSPPPAASWPLHP